MKERPILMSAPMVRAILDGTKTQTRRVVNDPPVFREDTDPPGWQFQACQSVGGGGLFKWTLLDAFLIQMRDFCPYGQPGDRLWVREAFCGPFSMGNAPPSRWAHSSRIWYLADGNPGEGDWTRPRPSIHMPRWASRLLLEITAVRVERLKDISEADARAEGAPPSHPSIDRVSREFGYPDFPRSWFGQLWESINGPCSWDANPWVWVIEFRRVQP